MALKYKGIVIENKGNVKQRLLQKLIEENEIEVSRESVDEEVNYRAANLDYQARYNPDQYGDYFQFTQEKLPLAIAQIREEVVMDLKIYQLLMQVAQLEKLIVTQEELEAELAEIAKQQNMTVDMVKNFLGNEPTSVKEDILLRKAEDFIYQNAKIV